jgi:hypothetical protein
MPTDEAVRSLIAPMLAADETVVATARVNYSGTVPPPTAGGLGGLLDETSTPGVVFPVARQMALALTDRRLVAWGLSLTGKPRDHLGEVPLGAVTGCRCTPGKRSSSLAVHLISGAEVDLEVMTGEDGVGFSAALSSLIA